MAAAPYLVDTNILLRLAQPGGPYDAIVVEAVEKLIAERTELFYTPQNAAEFWNVCTRPVERNGIGLDIAEADRRKETVEGASRCLESNPLSHELPSHWLKFLGFRRPTPGNGRSGMRS